MNERAKAAIAAAGSVLTLLAAVAKSAPAGSRKFDPARDLDLPLSIGSDLLPPSIVFEKWFFGAGKID
jgi:hypothetical protein